jgi:Flp pilus assembly protein TadD
MVRTTYKNPNIGQSTIYHGLSRLLMRYPFTAAFFVLALLLTNACGPSKTVQRNRYIAKGNRLASDGKFAEAAINYQKAIHIDPRSSEAYHQLGMMEWKLKDFTAAFQTLNQAVSLMPADDGALRDLGQLCLTSYLSDSNRPPSLRARLVKIADSFIAANASSFDGMRLKGYIAMADGKPDEAVSFLEKAQIADPFRPDVILALAQNLVLTGNSTRAEELALELVARHADFSPVYDFLYSRYIETRQYERAQSVLTRKVANNPREPMFVVELCRYFRRVQKKADTAACIDRLVRGYPNGYLLAGDFAAESGNQEEAVREYQAGIAAHPAERQAYRKRIAAAYIVEGKRDEAEQMLAEVLHDSPSDREGRGARALLLLQSRQPDKIRRAISEFAGLVNENSGSADLHEKLALAYSANFDFAHARSEFEAALRINSASMTARLGLTEVAVKSEQFADTVRYAGEILARDPHNGTARLYRATALIGLGRLAEGRSDLMAILRDRPTYPEANLQLAMLDVAERHYKEAESRFRKYYLPQKGDYRALKGLIEIRFATNDAPGAVELMRNEALNHPDSSDVQMLFGQTALRAGRFDFAVATYRALAERNPSDGMIRARLGSAELLGGNVPEAIKVLEQAKQLSPEDPQILSLLGSALEQGDRIEEAKVQYRHCLQVDPRNSRVMNNLAFLMLQTKENPGDAQKLVQRALQIEPSSPDFLDTNALIYLNQGSIASAFQILNHLAEKFPRNATYHHHFGLVLMSLGQKERARSEFRSALGMAPQPDERKQIERQLGSV